MREVTIDPKTATLIGFALKANQTVRGFEAVRRSIHKGKLAVILVPHEISAYSLRKLQKLAKASKLMLVQTVAGTDWQKLWGLSNNKILGILKGDLGNTIRTKFNAGV
ncbi:MAG: hypothetical protein Kow0042_13810 [Calditrichia bacterium]